MARQLLWILAFVVVVGGLFAWWIATGGQPSATPSAASGTEPLPAQTTDTGEATAPSSGGVPVAATVSFNGSSFSPASITIAQGGTVAWVSSDGGMWVASDPYPLQNGYDGTTMEQHCAETYQGAAPFDECAAGTTFSFTFNKVGTWAYHDYLANGIGGQVVVVAQ